MNKNNLYISNSKEIFKFILKLVVFALMIMGYFDHIMPQYANHYNASLMDKVERLKTVEGAKIVLLGDSNLSFGIDSEMIEAELGMPVVNMGLHRGLGNVFHERMAGFHVTEEDIYILCHTDYSDDDMISDPVLAWSVIEDHFALWKILRITDIYPMIKAYPVYLKKCLGLYAGDAGNADPGGCYARSAFNRYGDVSVERIGSECTFTAPISPPPINEITVNRINELDAWLEKQGATLLVAAYPIGQGEWTAPKEEFEEFQTKLEDALKPEVISQYTDYMYDYSCFYNSILHLNSEGAAMRTRQLIEDIKRWQNPYLLN